MTGPLEDTNKGSVAKGNGNRLYVSFKNNTALIMRLQLCRQIFTVRNDNYDLNNSHFITAMIQKFVNARKNGTELVFWGRGSRGETLFVDDCSDACIYLMEIIDQAGYYHVSEQDLTIQ